MRSSSAPAGHGSCDRSTVATSRPSRSRRPVAPLRYGASHASSVRTSVATLQSGHGSPIGAMQELDALAEPDRVGGPSEHGELGRAHTLQERGDGCVAWCRRTALDCRGGSSRAGARRSRRDRPGATAHVSVRVSSSSSANTDTTSSASIAAPSRIRARSRLPSRSAATTNSSAASGSVSGSHAPDPVRSWNCPARRRPASRSGNASNSVAPEASTVDVAERVAVESDARPLGDVGRPVAQPLDGTTGRPDRAMPVPATTRTRIAMSAGTSSDRPRSTSRSSTIAASTHASGVGEAAIILARRGCTGRPEHLAAEVGEQAAVVERAELAEQGPGGGERLRRRAVDERQLLGFGVPCGELEGESGEVDLGDLGRPVRLAGAVLELAPQPVAGARAGSSGAPGPLVGRRPTRRHGREPRHPGPHVEARRPCEAAVDHDAHPLDRERRLGDVGGQDHPPATGR